MKKLFFLLSFFVYTFSLNAQSYCAAGPTASFDSEITGVALTGDNYSISQLSDSCGSTGVQDFIPSDSADLSLGTSYALDVTMGTCGGSFAGALSAWIDFNGDGDFDDAGEQLGVFAGTPPTVTQQWTFSVPGTAVLGQTVLRVMQQEGGSVAGISPCNTFNWGAVEDYRINITNTPPACPNPSNLTVTAGANDASLTWDGAANYYIVEYDPSGFTPGTGDTVWVTTDSVFLANLTSSTSYDFYVSAMCTSGPSTGAATALNVFTQCDII
ncbi:GEVED domain-containing protein, partial [Schleiferiaceae bacterium]|nr:GEVED domain-containing protein [Schleiferiaceae bacterium]